MYGTFRNRLGLTLGIAASGVLSAGGAVAEVKKVPLPKPRPAIHAAKAAPKDTLQPASKPSAAAVAQQPVKLLPQPSKQAAADPKGLSAFAQAGAGLHGALFASRATFKPLVRPAAGPFSVAPSASTSAADIALVKQVIDATRKANEVVANVAQNSITDPVARKLAEWIVLRSDNTKPAFQRYAAFVATNPSWPHSPLFRRRAENALWNDKLDDTTVRSFFATNPPTTAKGRYMLARAQLAQGDRASAEALVRHAWQHDDASADVEKRVLEMFGPMITPADHKIRMEQRFYVDDVEAGMRSAERLGGNDVAVAKARAGVIKKAGNAKALLDAVPTAARNEAGYIFARAQWLRKNDKAEEAGKLILTAPKDGAAMVDLDQWWMERRLLVRKLLDEQDAHTAYRVAREAPSPPKGNYRVDQHFTAGWIALRFLHDAPTAAQHFAKINDGTTNPHALARGGYWQGRAAEAMSQNAQAKAFYEVAAQHTATYYGQLARARLGLTDIGLRGPPTFTPEEKGALSNLEIVRAAEILYALD